MSFANIPPKKPLNTTFKGIHSFIEYNVWSLKNLKVLIQLMQYLFEVNLSLGQNPESHLFKNQYPPRVYFNHYHLRIYIFVRIYTLIMINPYLFEGSLALIDLVGVKIKIYVQKTNAIV